MYLRTMTANTISFSVHTKKSETMTEDKLFLLTIHQDYWDHFDINNSDYSSYLLLQNHLFSQKISRIPAYDLNVI